MAKKAKKKQAQKKPKKKEEKEEPLPTPPELLPRIEDLPRDIMPKWLARSKGYRQLTSWMTPDVLQTGKQKVYSFKTPAGRLPPFGYLAYEAMRMSGVVVQDKRGYRALYLEPFEARRRLGIYKKEV